MTKSVLLVKMHLRQVIDPCADQPKFSVQTFSPGHPGERTVKTEPYRHTHIQHIPDKRSIQEMMDSKRDICGRIEWEGGCQYVEVPLHYIFIGPPPGFNDTGVLIHYGEHPESEFPAQKINVIHREQ